MTLTLDIAEPQRQTFVEFLKTLPYVTLVSEDNTGDATDWEKQTTQSFLNGYADSDAIYDEL